MMNDEKTVLQIAEHHKKKEKKRSGEIGITWWQLSLIGITRYCFGLYVPKGPLHLNFPTVFLPI